MEPKDSDSDIDSDPVEVPFKTRDTPTAAEVASAIRRAPSGKRAALTRTTTTPLLSPPAAPLGDDFLVLMQEALKEATAQWQAQSLVYVKWADFEPDKGDILFAYTSAAFAGAPDMLLYEIYRTSDNTVSWGDGSDTNKVFFAM